MVIPRWQQIKQIVGWDRFMGVNHFMFEEVSSIKKKENKKEREKRSKKIKKNTLKLKEKRWMQEVFSSKKLDISTYI